MHTKVVLSVSLALIIIGTLLIKLTEPVSWLCALFHSVSTRTAGFASRPIGDFGAPALLVMIVLMFIGASPGSTGGGIKTTTAALLILSAHQVLFQKPECVIFGRRIDQETIHRAFAITTLSIIWIFLAIIGITYLEETSLVEALFEVVSAYATVGLSSGLSQHLTAGGKIIMILCAI